MKLHTYKINDLYSKKVAYFSMEYAIEQSLKTYSGGLGYLSGSHMRSAYDLGQNMIGIGILWSFGYYDQGRDENRDMKVEWIRKYYYFLKELDIEISIKIHNHIVWVKAYLLEADTFGTAPVIFLTTDFDKNDYLSRTISHKLYDKYEDTRIAQEILLGIGGVKVLEKLGIDIDVYHLNEGHALPLAFELYKKYNNSLKEHIVFTTHTPEKAGNEEHNIYKLLEMGFFGDLSLDEVREITKIKDDNFSLTLGALRVSKRANAVSKLHGEVSNKMWDYCKDIAEITYITNAQNRGFWADKTLLRALDEHEDFELIARKKHMKKLLFEEVADQSGKLFDPDVLTIVWARRIVEYKRPWLLVADFERFHQLVSNQKIQIIWAGKPYPEDENGIKIFNELHQISYHYSNVAVLTGYELKLSRLLKRGADIWLNTPRITREASGTSGMSAAMNGAINFSINDGWIPEFAQDNINCFIIPTNPNDTIEIQDKNDNKNMFDILENKIIPIYYKDENKWLEIMKNSMRDVNPRFDSGRMAYEYYDKMYNFELKK